MDPTPAIEDYFVCIGAQKAGTTWLMRMLGDHEDIFVTPVKEIHYFDHIAGLTQHLNSRKRRSRRRKFYQRMWTQWHKWSEYRAQTGWYQAYMKPDIDDDWYASLFAEKQGRRIAGEATPEYALIGEAGFRHLKRLAPDARIIYLLRNPVTRAWSQLLHQCRARKLDADRLTTAQFMEIACEKRFEALANYPPVLKAIDKVFKSDRILLEFYEDIHADRPAAMKRICQFLGVAYREEFFNGLEKRYNPSQPAQRMPAELRKELRIKYRPMVREVGDRLGRLPAAWRKDFNLPAS